MDMPLWTQNTYTAHLGQHQLEAPLALLLLLLQSSRHGVARFAHNCLTTMAVQSSGTC